MWRRPTSPCPSLEHGAGLDVGKLPELARALDCTLTYLVGLTDDPGRWEPDGVRWPRERRRLTHCGRQPRPVAGPGAGRRRRARRSSVPTTQHGAAELAHIRRIST